jgi:hypothetical protein
MAIALACLGVFQKGATAERAQSAERHRIIATVESVADSTAVGNRYLVADRMNVSYEFRGVTTTGSVAAPNGAKAGSCVAVWIDDHGRPVRAPQTRPITIRDTTLAALFGLTALIVLVAGGRAAYDSWSIRQHADEWDADWLRFDRNRRG